MQTFTFPFHLQARRLGGLIAAVCLLAGISTLRAQDDKKAGDAYLGANDLLNASQRRLARISEFQQIALDIIIREQYPEYRDRIIAEADKRLERYHGA